MLRPGGRYFSQQIGAGSNRELSDFMMGPQPVSPARDPSRAVAAAEAAGLVVTDLREQALRTVFNDVGAVVYFLRKVLWTVPGFTVARLPGPAAAAARADPGRGAVRGARPAVPDRGAQAVNVAA